MAANSNVTTSQNWPKPVNSLSASTRWWRAYRGALIADWTERRRDVRVKLVLALALLLAIAASVLTAANVKAVIADRALAKQVEEDRWDGQGKKNAHSAAHYGIYVFKPVSALSAIEPGIERHVGSTVWLEAHKQNEFVLRPANDRLEAARQLPLTPALVLQVLAPVAMIFLGFGLFAAERERGTLRSLRMTAASFTAIGAARATTLWLAGTALALPMIVAVIVVLMAHDTANPFVDVATRCGLFTVGYAAYLAIWALTIAAVSASSRTARAALATLIALWALWALVLPRVAVEVAKAAKALPSAQAFREQMERELGEPHDPDVEAKYKADILAKYGVTDIKDLPVNWSGISLARGEARGDKIFDRYYGALFAALESQSAAMSAFGWLSPGIAVATLSASAAASDTAHHMQFVRDAETHRRLIQTMLNDFITNNPDREGQRVDGDAALWKSIPAFDYRFPAWHSVGAFAPLAQLAFLFLLALAIFWWRCTALLKEAQR
jgi:ABC-2 type transport system permease protein